MAQQLHHEPIRIQHGHDETHVLMIFSRPIGNLRLTLEEAEALIAGVRASIEKLTEYNARPALETGPAGHP